MSPLENLQALSHLLSLCPGAARPAVAHLALRAALHPSLRPCLLDPTLPLGGEFPSLDAHVAAILEFAAGRDFSRALLGGLPPPDREVLGFGPTTPAAGAAAVGALWGALYVPPLGRAVPCRVFAAYGRDPGDSVPVHWPEVAPVRPLGSEILDSARAAFAAALHTAETGADLNAPLWPAPVFFDVCAPDLSEEDLERSVGDSLGLPLALAFLSALTAVALPPDLAATGAVGRLPRHPGSVSEVGWVPQKASALRTVARRLLAPVASGDCPLPTTRALSVREAARAAGAQMKALFPEAARPAPRVPPPTGTVTFLFTEIEGGARLWETAPAAMREAVDDHRRLLHAAVTRHHGYPFEHVGDGFRAAFARPQDACEAALAIQSAVHTHPWPAATRPVRVRIGIHTGTPEFFRGAYYGAPLHQTSRLMSAGHGGQILLSGAAHAALPGGGRAAPEDWILWPLGTYRLRDLSGPVPVFQLSRPPLPSQFAPLSTLDTRRHNLPVQVTPLLARDAEVAQLTGLLHRAETRLVTLTGPGGMGKTRLALQAAAESVDAFPDGVWFVPLAEARTAGDVAAALSETLGLRSEGADPAARVTEALGGRRTLLVLDNFENVLPGAAFVADLLRAAPRVVCLITSRALLQLRGEQRFEVPPLTVPAEGAPAADIRAAGSVALFCDRARAARLDWELSDADAPSVREICRQLDGLPLAIELAAARVRALPVHEIARRLSDAFRFLTTRLQDMPERHRTLYATLEWSYNLLDRAERRLLARLSVFAGDFTLEAAESVGDPEDTLDVLTGLEEKSLVTCRVEGAASRYRLLTMIRRYAREKLEAGGEVAAARAAHAGYYAALARRHGAAANTAGEVAAFDALEDAIENLRAAFEWFHTADPAALPAFVAPLCEFLKRRGHWRERMQWLRAAVGAAPDADPALRAWLHYYLANAEADAGAADAAGQRVRTALEAARALGDNDLVGKALNLLGMEATRAGQAEQAVAFLSEALEHFRRLGSGWGVAASLNNLGRAVSSRGDAASARAYFEQAIPLWRAIDDKRGLAYALIYLGTIAYHGGDYTRAGALYAEQLELSRGLRDAQAVAAALHNLGEVREKEGDFEAAVPLYAAAERLFTDLEHSFGQESARSLARCEAVYGAGRLRALREDFARRPTSYLQHVDSLVRRLPSRAAGDPA